MYHFMIWKKATVYEVKHLKAKIKPFLFDKEMQLTDFFIF